MEKNKFAKFVSYNYTIYISVDHPCNLLFFWMCYIYFITEYSQKGRTAGSEATKYVSWSVTVRRGGSVGGREGSVRMYDFWLMTCDGLLYWTTGLQWRIMMTGAMQKGLWRHSRHPMVWARRRVHAVTLWYGWMHPPHHLPIMFSSLHHASIAALIQSYISMALHCRPGTGRSCPPWDGQVPGRSGDCRGRGWQERSWTPATSRPRIRLCSVCGCTRTTARSTTGRMAFQRQQIARDCLFLLENTNTNNKRMSKRRMGVRPPILCSVPSRKLATKYFKMTSMEKQPTWSTTTSVSTAYYYFSRHWLLFVCYSHCFISWQATAILKCFAVYILNVFT